VAGANKKRQPFLSIPVGWLCFKYYSICGTEAISSSSQSGVMIKAEIGGADAASID